MFCNILIIYDDFMILNCGDRKYRHLNGLSFFV